MIKNISSKLPTKPMGSGIGAPAPGTRPGLGARRGLPAPAAAGPMAPANIRGQARRDFYNAQGSSNGQSSGLPPAGSPFGQPPQRLPDFGGGRMSTPEHGMGAGFEFPRTADFNAGDGFGSAFGAPQGEQYGQFKGGMDAQFGQGQADNWAANNQNATDQTAQRPTPFGGFNKMGGIGRGMPMGSAFGQFQGQARPSPRFGPMKQQGNFSPLASALAGEN